MPTPVARVSLAGTGGHVIAAERAPSADEKICDKMSPAGGRCLKPGPVTRECGRRNQCPAVARK